MINLLKIEWLKIKDYTAFKVLAICFAVGIVVSNYGVILFYNNVVIGSDEGAMLFSSFNPYSFSSTWQSTSYTSGFLLMLPAMLFIMLLTNEYMFRTNRQNVIDGWSRSQFISVKLAMALIFAIISTVLVFLTALGFGLASKTDFSFNGITHIGYFFLKALTYNLFAILISVLVKKTGFAIGIFFIYIGIENFVSQACNAYSRYLKETSKTDLGTFGDYLPMNAADGLLSFPENPFSSTMKKVSATEFIYVVLAFAIVYIILFTWWSRKKYLNSDL
jgi:ABC-2 type transport system permease protein